MTINVSAGYNFRCAERHYSNHTDNDGKPVLSYILYTLQQDRVQSQTQLRNRTK